MNGLPLIGLLLGSLAVTVLARRVGAAPPLVLVATGLAVSFIPGMPDYELDPDLVLVLVLPPLLYSAALESSVLSIRANLRSITSLAVGLVLFTTFAVGVVAHLLLPGLPLAAAFVLGAVVAPPDAVAAVAVGRRLGLPRRVMTVLVGESLFNDATALTVYRVAVAAATGAGMSLPAGVAAFVLACGGGVAIGLAVGWVVHRMRMLLRDPKLESALGLLVPFGAYLLAEHAHLGEFTASGVLAVVVAGLYLGHHAPKAGFATRLQDQAVWKAAETMLEAFVFGLIGLQLSAVVADVPGSVGRLVVAGLLITAVAMAVRPLWVFPTAYIRGALFPVVRRRRGAAERPPWRYPAVVSWAGMRGVVSVAAAAALPTDFPGRDQVLFLAFFATVATLLVQGVTLPWAIRLLRVRGTESFEDLLAEAQAQHAAAQAAQARLEELLVGYGSGQHVERVAESLGSWAEHRSRSAWERLGRPAGEIGEAPTELFRRLRREMLAAERATFVRFRDDRNIDDEVLRRVLLELDLEEAMLSR